MYLSVGILQWIASFELISEEIGDKMMWIANKSSKFSIKSAIKIIREGDTRIMADWSWVWRVRAPQRTKTFLWLTLHNKVLSNVKRFKRKMDRSPQCEICSVEVEDLDHLLRYCPNAIAVWQALQQQGLYSSANNEGLHGWIQQNITGKHEDPNWPTKFLITMWCIWKWQCMHCFETM